MVDEDTDYRLLFTFVFTTEFPRTRANFINRGETSREDEDDQEACIRESERCILMENIEEEIELKHPIVFDAYDRCDYHKQGKLEAFNVAMLKTILCHFEVPFRAKDREADLIQSP